MTIGGSVKKQPHWNSVAVESVESNAFSLCDPLTLTIDLWPNINWWAGYCDGLSLCQALVSAVLVLSCGKTDRQNHRDRWSLYSCDRFPLPELTARVHGPSWRPVNCCAFFDNRFDSPNWRVSKKCTRVDVPWTRVHFMTPVNSGRQLWCQKMHPSSRAVNSACELG